MNKLNSEAKEFAVASAPFAALAKENNIDIGVCPTYLSLATVKEFASKDMIVGAQNCHYKESGAFTGEISIPMLKELGIDWCLIGHSERRNLFFETDEIVNKKVKAALQHELRPIVCVGESLQQREQGKAEEIIMQQTRSALNTITAEEMQNVIIAYEPVWAIGTGKTATAEDANSAIFAIRMEIEKLYGQNVADSVIILYGGSVNANNCNELFNMPHIDGGLIGGASLKVEEFGKIVNYQIQ